MSKLFPWLVLLLIGVQPACMALAALPVQQKITPGAPRGRAKTVRLDRYGDPLPPGALARFGTTRLRHDGPPAGLAFCPDGRTLVSWSAWDETIRFWDLANGKELKRLTGAGCVALGLSRQPLFACAEANGIIRIRDGTGKEVRRLKPQTDAPRLRLVLSGDGSTLASVHDVYVRKQFSSYPLINLWQTGTGLFLRKIEAKDSMAGSQVVLSPDGGNLAIGGADGQILLYDVKTGKVRYQVEATGSVYHLALTLDGKTLASCGAGKVVQLWDTRTGKLSGGLPVADRFPESLVFSPDGKQLVVGTRFGIQVWDVAAKKMLRQFPRSSRWCDSFAISPDGKTLASIDSVIRLWDLGSGKELLPFDEPRRSAECLAFSPDGQQVAAGNVDLDDTIRIWSLNTGKQVHAIQKHTWTVHDLQFTRDGRNLISASADQTIRWWDVATARQVRVLRADDQVTSFALSPDGDLLAANGGRKEILLWDSSGKRLPGFSVGDHLVHRVAFGLGKRLLVATEYHFSTVRLWRVADRRPSCSFAADAQVSDPELAVSPDGKTLATAGDKGTVRLWELATGKERLRITLEGTEVVSGLAFAPHGQALAISSGQTIYLCGVATGKELGRLKAPATQERLEFSPDGKKLASVSRDATILVWDVSRLAGERIPPHRLEPNELRRLQIEWEGADARKAHLAANALAATPDQAVAFLKKRLRPTGPVSEKEMVALIADLDSDKLTVRNAAACRLEAMEKLAEPWLRKTLAQKPNLELRHRGEQLLAGLNRHPVSAWERVALRGVELLERIATRAVILHLRALAEGAPAARLTLDAKAALGRIRLRPSR